MDGGFWLVQNAKSGRYLGLPVDTHVPNSFNVPVQEVDHKFGWHIRGSNSYEGTFRHGFHAQISQPD
jgi:hypothetical protein